MYRICLIDDKAYGIPQVVRAIPEAIPYEFYYFDRAADLDRSVDYDAIVLDFFLDKEGKTALDFIDSFAAWPVVSFSSDDAKNDLVIERGAIGKARKLGDSHDNPELAAALRRILGRGKEG